MYVTHTSVALAGGGEREERRGLKLTLKPLAYAHRNGGRDKGEVGGHVRKCGGKGERVNVEVLNERRGEELLIQFSTINKNTHTHTQRKQTLKRFFKVQHQPQGN